VAAFRGVSSLPLGRGRFGACPVPWRCGWFLRLVLGRLEAWQVRGFLSSVPWRRGRFGGHVLGLLQGWRVRGGVAGWETSHRPPGSVAGSGRVLGPLEVWRVWGACPSSPGGLWVWGACPLLPWGVADWGCVSVPWRHYRFGGCVVNRLEAWCVQRVCPYSWESGRFGDVIGRLEA